MFSDPLSTKPKFQQSKAVPTKTEKEGRNADAVSNGSSINGS